VATSIQIAVTLDDKGVVTGVNNIESGLQKVGQRGNVIFTSMAKQQRETRQAAGELAQAFGIQLTGGMEKAIAKMPTFRNLLLGAVEAGPVVALGIAFLAIAPKIQEAALQLGGFTQTFKDLEDEAHKFNLDQFLDFDKSDKGRQKLSAIDTELQQLAKRRAELNSEAGLTRFFKGPMGSAADVDELQRINDRTNVLIATRIKATDQLTHVIVKEQESAATHKEGAAAIDVQAKALEQLLVQMQHQHDLAGQQGGNQILAEERQRIEQLTQLGVDYNTARETAEIEANDKIVAERSQFTQRIKGLTDEAALAGLDERQKSVIQEQQRVDALIAEYDRDFKAFDDTNAEKLAAHQQLEQGLTAIHQQGAADRAQIDQRAADKAAEEAQRAADEMKRAFEKMAQDHKQAVGQMASQLESLFSGNIAQNILNLLKKFLFKMLAEWLSHFSALQNGFGGLFSKLFGGGGGGGFSFGNLFGGASSGATPSAGGGSSSAGSSSSSSASNPSSSSSGGMFGGSPLGNLLGAGIFMGVGAVFSHALSDILSPTAADRPKADIAKDVMAGDQASLQTAQGILEQFKQGKILFGQAIDKVGYLEAMAFTREGYFNPAGQKGVQDSFENVKKQIRDFHDNPNPMGVKWGAAQFHDGGEVPAVLEVGEHVIKKAAARRHRGTLESINNGTYDGGSGGTIIVQAIDSKSVAEFLRDRDNAKAFHRGMQRFGVEGGGRP
jgi:hypothetical protein